MTSRPPIRRTRFEVDVAAIRHNVGALAGAARAARTAPWP